MKFSITSITTTDINMMDGKSSEEKLEILNNDRSKLLALLNSLQQLVTTLSIPNYQLQNEISELLEQLAHSRELAGKLSSELSDDNKRMNYELADV